VVYFLLGSFTVEPGKGLENNLINARKILRRGGVVVIFPEGEMNKTGELLLFKKGAAVLAIEEKVPILPMYITERYNFDEGKRIIGCQVGERFNLNASKDYIESSNTVREKLINLKSEVLM
jgi:hypothetical protein